MVSRLRKLGLSLLALSLTFLMFGCGGGGSSSATQLRVLAASPDETSVNVLVDGTNVSSNLAYQANTGYLPENSGSRHLQIEPVNTTTNVIDTTLNLADGTETTFIMAGFSSSLQGLILTDDNTEPSSGTMNIRLVNASPSLGAVNVYVVTPGTSLSSVVPTVQNLGVDQASQYFNFNVGTSTAYEIYFVQGGTIFLDTGPQTFGSGQNRTIVALNNSSSYTFTMLKDLN